MWTEVWRDSQYKIVKFEEHHTWYAVFSVQSTEIAKNQAAGGMLYSTLTGAMSYIRRLEGNA